MNELIDCMIVASENEEGCIKFLNNLHERGLEGKEVELIIVEGGSGTGEGVRPGIFIYRDTEVLGSQVKEFSGGVTEEDT